MPEDEVKRFIKDLVTNESMQREVKAKGTNVAEIVEYANSKGYRFSLDDLDNFADNVKRQIESSRVTTAGALAVVVAVVVGAIGV